MVRKAFLMTLKPGHQAEYQRRHNPIWPELQQVLREHGVRNYSIFLDPAAIGFSLMPRSNQMSCGDESRKRKSAAAGGHT